MILFFQTKREVGNETINHKKRLFNTISNMKMTITEICQLFDCRFTGQSNDTKNAVNFSSNCLVCDIMSMIKKYIQKFQFFRHRRDNHYTKTNLLLD